MVYPIGKAVLFLIMIFEGDSGISRIKLYGAIDAELELVFVSKVCKILIVVVIEVRRTTRQDTPTAGGRCFVSAAGLLPGRSFQ